MLLTLAVSAQETLTVYDGTNTSNTVPMYIFYFDSFTRSQYIIPATALEDMEGGTITTIQWYSSTNSYTTQPKVDIYITEVDYTSISSFIPKSSATLVYSDIVTITNNVATITLTTPYVYEGGNLLIGAENLTNPGYQSVSFYGQQVSGASIYGYNYSSTTSVSPSQANFIPKTTFLYESANTTCPKPRNLTATDITSSSATLSWTPQGEETTWSVQYRMAGASEWIDKGTFSSPTCSLDNLADYTEYQFRVMPNCEEDAQWTSPTTFRTLWAFVTIDDEHPYSTGFEGENLDWVFFNGTQTNAWAWGTATQNVGNKSLYVSNNGGSSYYYNRNIESVSFVVKPIHLLAGYHHLSFDWMNYGESGSDYLRVALAPGDVTLTPGTRPCSWFYEALPTGWIAMDGGNQLSLSSTWQTQINEFNIASEGDYMVVLAWDNDYGKGTQPPAAVDNFNIHTVDCPRPNKPTIASITTSSAVASWTPNGDESEWLVQLRKVSDASWTDKGSVTTPTYSLDNLEDYTDYLFRVKPVCDGYGDWSPEASFKTLWVVTTIDEEHPYSTGFEDETLDWYFINGTQTNAWAWGTATQNGGNKSLYVSNDAGASNQYILSSNSISYAFKPLHFNAGYHAVSFDWKNNGEQNCDYLRVALAPATATLTAGTVPVSSFYSNVPTGWIALDGGSQLQGNNSWQSQSLELNVPSGGDYMVVLAWVNDGSSGTQPPASIDNFSVYYLNCPCPKALALSFADTDYAEINWNAVGSETTWNMQYKLAEATAWTDVTETIDAHPYTLSGLEPGTDYQVRIQAGCGSTWSEALSFTTLCEPIDGFPFLERFSSISSLKPIPDCWNNTDGTLTDEGHRWSYTNEGHNGNAVRFIAQSSPSGQTSFLKTPIMNLPSGESMQLSFWYKNDNGASFSVYISTDRGRTYSTALATNLPTTTGWTEKEIAIPDAYAGAENVVFIFKGITESSFKWILLDDVTVEVAPTCLKPKDLTLTGITQNSATLAWTPQGSEDTWEIAYSTDPDFDPDGYGTRITVTENPFTLNGLRSGLTYYAYVRAKCGAGEVSHWCNDVCSFYTVQLLTVNDGTAINNYVPARLYHLNTSLYTGWKSQFIIPASSLTEMRDSQINKMTFYSNTTTPYFYGATYKIYMVETEQTTFGNTINANSMTLVYTGTLTGRNNRLEIVFDTPFQYSGGNLAIGFNLSQIGNYSGEDNGSWIGVTTTGYTAKYQSNSGGFNQTVMFLPKITFAFATVTSPYDLTVSDLSASGATLSWHPKGNEDHWDVFYTDNPDFVPRGNTHPQFANIGSNPYVLSDLEPGRNYYVYVRANEGSGSVSEWSLPCSFMIADLLTVYDGTNATVGYHDYVPVPGYYVNQPFFGEFVMPANDLQDMAQTMIKQVTFYTSTPANINWGELDYNLFLSEVDFTETNTNHGGGQQVFSGVVGVTDNKMTVTFDEPYYYEGGNLLVRFSSERSGAVNRVFSTWAGVVTENSENYGSSVIQYRDGSWFNVHSYYSSFLPKTTFRYYVPDEIPQTCNRPTDLEVSGITANSATVSWTANSSVQAWEIQYTIPGHEADYVEVPGTVTNPCTLQGLEPSQGYWVRVRAVCDNDFYSDWTETWFSTECAPITLPYSYGFEDTPYGGFPPCWTCYYSGEGVDESSPISVSNYGNTEPHSLIFSYMDGTTAIAALPEIPEPISGVELVFYAAGYGENTYCDVGVMTDPTNPETFELVEALTIEPQNSIATNGYQRCRVSFGGYSGEGTYIAIRRELTDGMEQRYLFVDDVVVRQISTCLEPTDLTVTAFTTHSATIQWTPGGDETTWQVQLKDIEDEWPDDFQTCDSNPVTFDGLVENTMYHVRVKAVCSDIETSDWSEPICFTLAYTAPFFEDFGNYPEEPFMLWGWQTADASLDDVLGGTPLGMRYVWNGNHDLDWVFYNDATGMTYYIDGYNHMEVSYTDDHHWFVTPSIVLGENYSLSLDLFLRYPENATTGLDDNRFAVLVSDDDGATWTTLGLWDNIGTQGGVYLDIPTFPSEVHFDLSAYNNKTVLFAFYGESTVANDYGDDDIQYSAIYFDKINVTKCIRPDNVVPTDITTNSVVLDWTSHGETSWTLRYRTSVNDDWTISTITQHPYPLTGLRSSYRYQVQLKAHNEYGESEWSDLVIFETECAPIVLGPDESYIQSFDDLGVYHFNQMPACWLVSGTDNVWRISYGYATASLTTLNTNAHLITPEIYVTPGLALVFHHSTELNTLAHAEVVVMTDYSTTVWSSDTDGISDGVTTISLSDYVGQTVRIWFGYRATSNGNYGTATSFSIYDVALYNRNVFAKQTSQGLWSETANWSKGVLPEADEMVIVDGAAVIPSGCVAQVDEVYLTSNGSLTLADGAQLKHNNEGVQAKARKSVSPYAVAQTDGDQKADGWHLIASPMQEPIMPSETMLSNAFDLYRFNQSAMLEWENYNQYFYLSPYFKLHNGQGYLYANSGDGSNPSVIIDMEGVLRPAGEDVEVPLTYDASAEFPGFNLVGNPFACDAYLTEPRDFYVMNTANDELEISENDAIAPLQGLFVQAADANDDAVTFTTVMPDNNGKGGQLTLNVFNGASVTGNRVADRARVRFGEGPALGKFSLRPDGTKLYILQDRHDYAVVYSDRKGEVPVNFKAEKNGTYTLTVSETANSQLPTPNYLHLIDHLTGADVDLLQTPSYTFEAKTTDYASRFKLVFNADDAFSDMGDDFAFISDGHIVVNGTGTLQIFDVLGHQLFSKELSTANCLLPTPNFTVGVYVLRLISGSEVKTQKIVVRE